MNEDEDIQRWMSNTVWCLIFSPPSTVQDIVFQLQRFVSGMSHYYDDCYAVLKEADVFPIEVDLSRTTINYGSLSLSYNDDEEEEEEGGDGRGGKEEGGGGSTDRQAENGAEKLIDDEWARVHVEMKAKNNTNVSEEWSLEYICFHYLKKNLMWVVPFKPLAEYSLYLHWDHGSFLSQKLIFFLSSHLQMFCIKWDESHWCREIYKLFSRFSFLFSHHMNTWKFGRVITRRRWQWLTLMWLKSINTVSKISMHKWRTEY